MERLLLKTERVSSGCLEWTGKRTAKGYGLVKRAGKWVRAHRVMYEASKGPIPAGGMVCHTCDNPSCVEPEHLYAGTAKDNVRDAMVRGRMRPPPSPSAELKPNARVSEADVLEIRERVRRGERYDALADEYGLDSSAVSLLVRGKTWPDVPGAVTDAELAVLQAHRRKLRPADVAAIRGSRESAMVLAKRYGVHFSTIYRARA